MSQENVEVVRRVYDAAAHRDAEEVFSLYDPDVELDNSRLDVVGFEGPGSGVYRGHDGLRRFFHEWHEAWEDIEYDFDDRIDAGDEQVIAVVRRRARGRSSGAEVEWDHTRGPAHAIMGASVYRGHEGVRRWFRELYEAFADVEAEIPELIDTGEHVVSVRNYQGRGRVSGVEVAFRRRGSGPSATARWCGGRVVLVRRSGPGGRGRLRRVDVASRRIDSKPNRHTGGSTWH